MFGALTRNLSSQCLACGRWPARPLCPPCQGRFGPRGARCGRCALPVPAGVACCGACLSRPPPLDACLAAVDYAYPWAGLLARFKFQGDTGLAGLLARTLATAPGVDQALAGADLVLPLPLSPERLRERGFNQALELARRLPTTGLQPRLLLRPRHRPPQSDLSRAERLANVQGVFAVDPLASDRLRGAAVLLVDDVMTSGASLHAAAQVLRRAGVARVTALVVARTPDPG